MKKLLASLFLVTISIVLANGPVFGVSGSEWRAGRIIDDSVFSHKDSMSVQQIQDFLNSKVASCDTNHSEGSSWRDMGPPYICLRSYREDPNIPIRDCTEQEVQTYFGFGSSDSRYQTALNYCWWKDGRANIKGQAVSGNARTAAQIIWQASQDYNISPKVLIVTLQKEQSLVTDTWPWVGNFQKAMGYACPDSGTCNPSKRGFYNQVRSAAWQLRRYIDYPQNYNFAIGVRNIQYHPNASCGDSSVNIETAATAALYNYTPYQPNAAALNNLYGTGNSCSSYGNRNFWRMYNDWFGRTLAYSPSDIPLSGDWDGNGTTTAGVKHGNYYVLDNNNDGRGDIAFTYGLASYTPIVGDWDGDGVDTIALKNGNKYFINNEFDGSSAFRFFYGNSTDIALSGDWDGNGSDTISLKRGNKYFINNEFDGASAFRFFYGNSTDIALSGDWDGNGSDTISLKRGNKYFINNEFDGASAFRFFYGEPTYIALSGDWDGNGSDTISLNTINKYFINNELDGTTQFRFYFLD